MPEFVLEFQDIIGCRGESVESLKKKFNISPRSDNKDYKVKINKQDYWFSKEDIMKVLEVWRSAARYSKNEKPTPVHVFKMPYLRVKKSDRKNS